MQIKKKYKSFKPEMIKKMFLNAQKYELSLLSTVITVIVKMYFNLPIIKSNYQANQPAEISRIWIIDLTKARIGSSIYLKHCLSYLNRYENTYNQFYMKMHKFNPNYKITIINYFLLKRILKLYFQVQKIQIIIINS